MQILVEAFANDQWIVRQECYKELSKNRSVYAYIECLRHLNDREWIQFIIGLLSF